MGIYYLILAEMGFHIMPCLILECSFRLRVLEGERLSAFTLKLEFDLMVL